MAFCIATLSSGRIVPRVTIGRVTPFIPHERPNVKHSFAGYLRLPRPTPAPAQMTYRSMQCIYHANWYGLLNSKFVMLKKVEYVEPTSVYYTCISIFIFHGFTNTHGLLRQNKCPAQNIVLTSKTVQSSDI